jgi:hypothetical protein
MPDSGSPAFKSVLSEAIGEGLSILGGEDVKQAFFYQVGKRGVQRSEIPVKLGTFHKILTDIFDSGALILERMIAKSLYSQLGLEFEVHSAWSLEEYAKLAQQKCAEFNSTPESRRICKPSKVSNRKD